MSKNQDQSWPAEDGPTEGPKICPIRRDPQNEIFLSSGERLPCPAELFLPLCLGSKCAWWHRASGSCVAMKIADTLHRHLPQKIG